MDQTTKAEMVEPMKIFFEPMPGYSEAYEVKYWDHLAEYSKLKTVMLYTAGKGRHDQVEKLVMRTYRLKFDDIHSVKYQ